MKATWSGWIGASHLRLVDRTEILRERSSVLAAVAAICALGLVAAGAAHIESQRWPILIVTFLVAAVVALAAGLTRGRTSHSVTAMSRALPPAKGKPTLVVIQGGA